MPKELEKNQKLKEKVAEIMTLMAEIQELSSDPKTNQDIQTSVDFISKSLIDLKYKIYDQG